MAKRLNISVGARVALLALIAAIALWSGVLADKEVRSRRPQARSDGQSERIGVPVDTRGSGFAGDVAVRRLVDSLRTGPWSIVSPLLESAGQLNAGDISERARAALLQVWIDDRCRVVPDQMVRLLLRLGVEERTLADIGLGLIADEGPASDGVFLLKQLPGRDDRIERELGRLLAEEVARSGSHPSHLTLAVETALLRRGRPHAAVIDAVARDLAREPRENPLQIARKWGPAALPLERDIRRLAMQTDLADDERVQALRALVAIVGVDGASAALRLALEDSSPFMRLIALRECEAASLAPTELIPRIVPLLQDKSLNNREASFRALARWADQPGVASRLAERMRQQMDAYRASRSLDDAYVLQDYCESLGEYPSRSAALLELLSVLAGDGFAPQFRWRAVFADWRSRGNTLAAARTLTAMLPAASFVDRPQVVNRLARMAYPEGASGAAEHPDAALVRRLVADDPAALSIVRALQKRGGIRADDARRLLRGQVSATQNGR